MRKTTKFGWNIVVYGKNYYAMRQVDGYTSIEDLVDRNDDIKDATNKLGNSNILVGDDEEGLIKFIKENCPYPQFTIINQGFMGYNIGAFGKVFSGLQQIEGDQKISEQVSEYETEETAKNLLQNKNVIVSSCLVSLMESIKTKYCYPTPQILEENVNDFNIVGYLGMFYAIKRGVDINLDEVEEESLKLIDDIYMARNLTDLKNLIE
jgi:hypothetical protein